MLRTGGAEWSPAGAPAPQREGARGSLPAPRPACSVLLRCRGLRCENACPLGKRNVCKMFAIN